MKKHFTIIYSVLALLLLCSCGEPARAELPELDLAAAEQTIASLDVSAPGTSEQRNDQAVIDYSNTADGYVMVKYLQDTQDNLKAQVKGPESTYTYVISSGKWSAFPLSEGDGDYQVAIFDNIEGTRYAMVLSASFSVRLKDEFAPFLRPNEYVNFASAPKSVALAASLTSGIEGTLDKVSAIYTYVVKNLTYDKELAANVTSDYVPSLDSVLEKGSGICFDYAALMTGMLRSQGVPCKMVFGYAGDTYHAWITVWVEGQGWVDNVVHFNGLQWELMDPTYASAGNYNNSFITDETNYSAKFFY